ncbi:MAG: glutathione S-transferase [Gammaproteobacteria bacterium]|nr:glutathione S-transferase [Gammaproteobacteria bacterium]
MIPATALYAGVFGLLSVTLANAVLFARLRTGKLPGWQPDAVLRVQANFVENVPLALVMLLVLELIGTPPSLIHSFGSALLICRLLHAYGLGTRPGANYPRLIGAQGTFLVMSAMAVALLFHALDGT